MAKFTKKPVQIEAVQYKGTVSLKDARGKTKTWIKYDLFDQFEPPVFLEFNETPPYWIYKAITKLKIKLNPDKQGGLIIETLEGPMNCPAGSWIIKGVQNEIYAIDPVIFSETYEPV